MFPFDDVIMPSLFQLTLLRINDFMALVSPDNEGYTNNAVSSHTESRLNLTFAYVAGVPNSVAGLPFATPTDVPVRTTAKPLI